mmetsp:Transcript_89731/g.253015  ORF Transcript_89731/g.253015 Transcript_89731/m.253015 type:complete len:339 (-) Transcript_89731:199-1215(-)
MVVTLEIVGTEADECVRRAWPSAAPTLYIISVRDGESHWNVSKRYKDFLTFDLQLQKSRELVRPTLPAKGMVGFRQWLDLGSFNEQRRIGLNTYLTQLAKQVQTLEQSPALLAFLGVPQPPDEAPLERGRVSTILPSGEEDHDVDVSHTLTIVPRDAVAATADGEDANGPDISTQLQSELVESSRQEDLVASEHGRGREAEALDPGCLSLPEWRVGPDWRRFKAAEPALADLIQRGAELLADTTRCENDSEAVFVGLRRTLKPLARSGRLAEVPGKVVVWEVLALVAARRPFFRPQVVEIMDLLGKSELWSQALNERADLSNSLAKLRSEEAVAINTR